MIFKVVIYCKEHELEHFNENKFLIVYVLR